MLIFTLSSKVCLELCLLWHNLAEKPDCALGPFFPHQTTRGCCEATLEGFQENSALEPQMQDPLRKKFCHHPRRRPHEGLALWGEGVLGQSPLGNEKDS